MRSRLHQGTCPDTLLSGPFNWTRSGIPGSITRVFHPLIFSILATLFLQACGAAKLPPSTARVVTDEIGRRVKVVSSPKRFISLAPSATEMLFALGLGQEVVGVTAYCDYPPQATRIEKIGDTQRPSLEKIVALKPDLVVVSTASQLEPFVQKLDEAAIPVYVSNPTNLGTLLDSIVKLGDVTGVPDRGRTLAAELRGRIDAVKTKVRGLPRTRVLLVLGTEPLITVGGNTFINDLIETAGGESISADQKSDYPQFSYETAIARQPEEIFMQAGGEPLPRQLESTAPARTGRVYHIDDAILLRPGPRIVDGLEKLAEKLHPEVFGVNPASGTATSR